MDKRLLQFKSKPIIGVPEEEWGKSTNKYLAAQENRKMMYSEQGRANHKIAAKLRGEREGAKLAANLLLPESLEKSMKTKIQKYGNAFGPGREKANTPESIAKRVANRDYSFLKDPEVRAKMSANIDYEAIAKQNRKPVLQYSKDGTFIQEFESVKAAKQWLGSASISANLNGTTKSAGGYVWKYKDNQ